jgi:glycerophosphoryl diester phosphodiesterase
LHAAAGNPAPDQVFRGQFWTPFFGPRVLVAAHRGDWRHAPENSLPAIEKCIALGVDIVELDLQRATDGALVLMHGAKLDRVTTGKGRVADRTLAEIKQLRLRNGPGSVNTIAGQAR